MVNSNFLGHWQIRAQLQEQGIQPREVRLMRNKSSGETLSTVGICCSGYPSYAALPSPFVSLSSIASLPFWILFWWPLMRPLFSTGILHFPLIWHYDRGTHKIYWYLLMFSKKQLRMLFWIFLYGLLLSYFWLFSRANHASVLEIITLWATFDTYFLADNFINFNFPPAIGYFTFSLLRHPALSVL